MTKIEGLQLALDGAIAALAAEVNRMYPVGSRVRFPCGRGWMYGTVVFEAIDADVRMRSDRGGHVHYKHYKYVERETLQVRRARSRFTSEVGCE